MMTEIAIYEHSNFNGVKFVLVMVVSERLQCLRRHNSASEKGNGRFQNFASVNNEIIKM